MTNKTADLKKISKQMMSKLYRVREQIGLLRNSTFQRCLSTTCSGWRSMIITGTLVMSVCREINLLYSRNICFQARYVLFPFRWLSMLSSHLSLGLPRGLFLFILKFITTLSIASSSLLMTCPNHRSLFLLVT